MCLPVFASPAPVASGTLSQICLCSRRPCPRASLSPSPSSLPEPLSSYSFPPDPTPRRGRAPRSPDYYVNIGRSIESLRSDYPLMLAAHPEWAAYAPNIAFKDRATGYSLSGLRAYERLLWAVRMQAWLCFSSAAVEIQSFYHDDDAGIVYLRWRLQATPRVWGLISPPPRIALDAMSVYGMDDQGRICEHALDNSSRSRPRKFRPFIEEVLAMGSTVVSAPEPTSGGLRMNFELPVCIDDDVESE